MMMRMTRRMRKRKMRKRRRGKRSKKGGRGRRTEAKERLGDKNMGKKYKEMEKENILIQQIKLTLLLNLEVITAVNINITVF